MPLENDVWVDSGEVKLAGTLTLPGPEGVFPACLLVHGTGPLDRDENMPGQNLDVFNTIARRLAAAGVATLRYDKRGCGKSTGAYHPAGHHDLVLDAANALDFLGGHSACMPDQLYALGHSEGALIVPELSLIRPALKGAVLLCPFVDPVEDILMAQAQHIEAMLRALPTPWRQINRLFLAGGRNVPTAQRKLIARVKSGDAPVIRVGFQRLPARALRELMELEPEAVFRNVICPMLAISGGKDVQCAPGDAARIASLVQGPVEHHCMPNLTHVLRQTAEAPSMLEYGALLRDPIDADLLELIADWLIRASGVREGGI